MNKRKYLLTLFIFISFLFSGCIAQYYNMLQPGETNTYGNYKKISEKTLLDTAISRENEKKESKIDEKACKIAEHDESGTEAVEANVNSEFQLIFDEALQLCKTSQDFWQKGDIEKALRSLDKANSLILTIDADSHPDFAREKEELRFLISKRIVEIYRSKTSSASGNGKTIPLLINDHVKTEINRFMKRNKRGFIEAYKRSGIYRPYIVKALKEAGLPEELSWLPMIESMFKVKALSKARALGLWQFIASTGYKFDLKRDQYVDERLDPIKSTDAAIAYLKELHGIFGDWTTALAAYNSGETRILRIIRTQNVNYLDHFWDFYEKLPRETAQYIPKFMAVIYIVNNLEEYGLENIETYPEMSYETLAIDKQMHLKDIAKSINVSYKTLKDLNTELRYQITPPGKYDLKLPLKKKDIMLSSIDEIPTSFLRRTTYIYHKIKKGESLSTIARKYKTSMKKIARANKIRKYGRIRAGKKIKIPKTKLIAYTSSESKEKVKAKKNKEPVYKNGFKYTVSSGESLWTIARKHNTTVKKLKKLNDFTSKHIYPGQVLIIKNALPYSKSITKAVNSSIPRKLYKVKFGDTPFTIASDYNMSLSRFLNINSLSPDSKVYPGQYIYVE